MKKCKLEVQYVVRIWGIVNYVPYFINSFHMKTYGWSFKNFTGSSKYVLVC